MILGLGICPVSRGDLRPSRPCELGRADSLSTDVGHRPLQLRRVAGTFADLQEDRHIADYNNQEPWTNTEVQEILIGVALAFQDWHSIRTDPMAGNYLLAMLIGKRRH